MTTRALGLIVLVLLISGKLFGAEPAPRDEKQAGGALEVIPAEAAAAIAIRNVAELTKRGDELIAKAEVKFDFLLSAGYRLVVSFLRIGKGLDETGAAALMAMKGDLKFDSLVLAVPVADMAAMAANFSLEEKDLVEGTVIDRHVREKQREQDFVRYVGRRGRHVFLGGDAKVVEHALQAKSLNETLSDSDRAALAGDDIVVYVHRKHLGDTWKGFAEGLKTEIEKLNTNDSEPLRQLAAATDELHSVVGGIRLDNGVGASLLAQFEGEKSRAVLTSLQGSKTPASLAGLPAGRMLAAHAFSGDGDTSAGLVRALLSKLPLGEQIAASPYRPQIVGVFGEVWQRLEGSRTALYENADRERHGHFALLTILETDDAERFVADVTSLARFVNAATLPSEELEAAIDAKTIAELVEQLGNDEYRTRQLASTKLGLIGVPALGALQAAAKSNDPEVSFRAQALCEQINTLVAAQREDLLKHDLLTRIKPSFAYYPKQETRAGRSVDIIQIRLRADEAEYAPQLRRFLGPEWSKMRLAVVGKRQVVVLLGSDTALFEQAVANVAAGEVGLVKDERLATFQKRTTSALTAEFHLQLARSLLLVAEANEKKPRSDAEGSVTSLGIAIAPQRVRVILFAPISDIKGVVKQLNW